MRAEQYSSTRFNPVLLLGMLLTVCLHPSSVNAEEHTTYGKLRVYPERVSISSARDAQSMVAMLVAKDGSTRDVTAKVTAQLDTKIARFENETVVPVANGDTVIKLAYEDQFVELPTVVAQLDKEEPVGFRKHILPILTKSGCNTGKCHGAASGKDGFRLSLYGFDPKGDHHRLTREMVGRRINLADPENCLLINKALGMVPHTGGGLMDQGDENYTQLIEWLHSGAPADSEAHCCAYFYLCLSASSHLCQARRVAKTDRHRQLQRWHHAGC